MASPMRTSLRSMRQKLGLQQQDLATQIAVSRQTLSTIESGETVPSTLIALNLARALHCKVEDLFALGDEGENLEAHFVTGAAHRNPAARLAAGAAHKARVALGQVSKQWVARSLDDDPAMAQSTPADGIATQPRGGASAGTIRVRPLRDLEALRRNLLVAGCDPALGLLGRHLEERFRAARLHWIELGSHAALEELAERRVSIAGVHLDDAKTGNHNVAAVKRRFGDEPMMLVTLASWELGLVYRAGKARAPKTVADLSGKGIRVIAREPGAGAQELLESSLKVAGVEPYQLNVVAQARGHRAVAQMVASGVGDAGIATRSAAASYDLAFASLTEARFDMVFSAESASDERVQSMLDCLSSARFRKDLGAMTGYRTRQTGDLVQGSRT
jgi:putative molybdopterin biosynthesis protein